MELYYKDLISEEASVEKLVDELMLIVQGADELAQTANLQLPREEIMPKLERLKLACRELQKRARAQASGANRFVRHYPYPFVGVAFVAGMLTGRLFRRSR